MIHKAEKAGLSVSIVEPDHKWIEEYYEMLRLTFEVKVYLYLILYLFIKKESLCLSKILFCMSVKIDNVMIAASIFKR